MKIYLSKKSDKIIGALRLPNDLFEKIEKIAKEQKVSNQEVIRAILIQVIDEVEVSKKEGNK